jgi:UDP-glucose 4-epimerase
LGYCEKAITSGALQLRGTGAESRDFIHAADISAALLLLAEKAPAQGEVYNLASGDEVTIAQLAELTLRALGRSTAPPFRRRHPCG